MDMVDIGFTDLQHRTTDDPVSSASSRTVAVGCGRRRVPDKLPTALWLVAVIGFWERAAFWGSKFITLERFLDMRNRH
jgi:hypothetical protein